MGLRGLALFLLASAALASPSADELLTRIAAQGAPAVVSEVWDDPEFGSAVYSGIGSGSASWVQVGAALLPYADASVSLGLASHLAEALVREPSNVLPLVNSSPVFAARRICLPFMSAEEPKEAHLAYLDKLEATLAEVAAPELHASKDACLQELIALRNLLQEQT